jgi:cytoskeleton protein RodZ
MRPNDESPGREVHAAGGGGLEKTFAAARAARGLTIEEIATELRIEPRLLRALEQGRFEDLGPPVFAKGYLKQYGNRLGLKYDDLLAEYYRLVEPKDVALAPSRTIKLRDERQITVWIIAALALALLGVFLLVWWLDEPAGVRAPAVPDDGDPPATAVGDAGAPRGANVAAAEPAAAVPGAETEPSAPPAGEAEARVTESAGEDAAPAGAAVATAAGTPAAAPGSPTAFAPEPAGPTLTLEFTFLEDCWLEATDARGARLFYGLGQAGALRRVSGAPPIDVFLGNANGVSLTVDGEPYVVPIRDRQRNLARFVVDRRTD